MIKQNYNHLFLRGFTNIDDKAYCAKEGLPSELMYNRDINNVYISTHENPNKALKHIQLLLADQGLLNSWRMENANV